MNYTSLELSKKLYENGCKLESEKHHRFDTFGDKKYRGLVDEIGNNPKGGNTHYPAYDILNDICCRYAKQFFGEEDICSYCGLKTKSWLLSNPVTCPECRRGTAINSYEYHTEYILSLRQQNKIQEAEDYIWEHCLFNPKNK